MFATHGRVLLTLNLKVVAFLFFSLIFSLAVKSQAPVNDSVATFKNDSCNANIISGILFNELVFTKKTDRRINLKLTGSEYHYIILKMDAEKKLNDQYLSLDNTSLDEVRIYKIKTGGRAILLYKGGQFIPYQKNRNYVWHTTPVDIGTTPSLYVIVVRAAQKYINIRYGLTDHNELENSYEKYDRIVFFYLGIAFMISAIILLALFLFKKKVFAVYFGYMLCISFWIIDHYGRVFPYLYPRMPFINEIAKPLSSLAAAFLLLTVQKLIFKQNLKDNLKLLTLINYLRTYLLFIMVLIFVMLIPAVHGILRAVLIGLWHSGLIFSIGLIAFIPLHFIRTGKLAKIFSLAMLAICLTTLIQLLANSGFITNYFISEHGMALGSLSENSIMAFGLLYGLLVERRDKELQLLRLEEEKTIMLRKLISVQDHERKRIAGDLHDNLGPLLAALKINFRRILSVKEEQKQMELINKTEDIIDDSIIEIRNIAHNLMPKNLSSNGLINTLSGYFEDMEQLYGKKIVFNHEVQSIFDPELQINIYWIICELVMNAARHSDAEMITVSIHSDSGLLSIFVQDNGQGFDLKQNGNKKAMGIQNAENRVDIFKGNFNLRSEVGRGTTVNIEIPI
ncbi:MAG: 7TM diverse intracellular signaling domain-containing protein [Ginsengibacter sp.]